MKGSSEKNHPARKKHANLSEVCSMGFPITSFPLLELATCGHVHIICRLFWWSCCSGGICISNQPSYGYQKRRMGQGGGSVFSSIFCTLGEW